MTETNLTPRDNNVQNLRQYLILYHDVNVLLLLFLCINILLSPSCMLFWDCKKLLVMLKLTLHAKASHQKRWWLVYLPGCRVFITADCSWSQWIPVSHLIQEGMPFVPIPISEKSQMLVRVSFFCVCFLKKIQCERSITVSSSGSESLTARHFL